MKPIVFHQQAADELEEAAAWYDGNRQGLGRDFLLSVENAVGRIRENPRLGSPYGGTRFRYVRTRRFPYLVIYAERQDVLWIMAVAHASRKPGCWMNRESR